MTIRDRLRQATRRQHDQLDRAMPHDLGDPAAYSRFLQIQLAARLPVEAWLARYVSSELIPPSQIENIRSDLTAMGSNSKVDRASFSLSPNAHALGVAWVLAGSHLGNRFLLQQLPRDAVLPTAFLADQRMIAFWKKLQPQLRSTFTVAATRSVIESAEAVFALFLKQTEIAPGRMAA